MCDTLVALGNSTKEGHVIFGKNSDRPSSEAQLITYSPAMQHSKEEMLQCTYISIPQVSETYAILLSQPFWMFGCEIGCNEYGVAIGNEAVHTKEPLKSSGLLGMDLLRLGLERAKTAQEAVNVITSLLESFGQGGNCSFTPPEWFYDNSYIISDCKEAYVLETAGKWWILENVKDVRSISNNLSIRGKGDKRRKGIIQHAIEQGYCKDDDEFDFAMIFSDPQIPNDFSPYSRDGCTLNMLNHNKGQITEKLMMEFLREHEAGICMHGAFESTGSQVSHLREGKKSIHWFTGTILPCVSIYKPYAFPIKGQKYYNPGPYPMIDSDWFWLKHARSKPINKKIELRNIENSIMSRINELFIQEDKISEEIFIKTIKMLNLEAWNKSYEIVS